MKKKKDICPRNLSDPKLANDYTRSKSMASSFSYIFLSHWGTIFLIHKLIIPITTKIILLTIATLITLVTSYYFIPNLIKYALTSYEVYRRKMSKKDIEDNLKEYNKYSKIYEHLYKTRNKYPEEYEEEQENGEEYDENYIESSDEWIEPCPTFETVFPEFAIKQNNDENENKLQKR